MRIETTTDKFNENDFVQCEFVKEDKNGTKTYNVIGKCDKCGGKGVIEYFHYWDKGVCYGCMGSGHKAYTYLVRTPEYAKALEEKRIAKAKKIEEENRLVAVDTIIASMEKRLGFIKNCKNGKCENCKHKMYCSLLKEFVDDYTNKTPRVIQYCPKANISDIEKASERKEYKSMLNEIVELRKSFNTNKVEGNYLGNVGDRIEFVVKDISRLYTSSVNIGYGREIYSITYKIVTTDGSVVLWTTGTCLDETVLGKTIKGTIKELKEYKGEKETVITRGKVGE